MQLSLPAQPEPIAFDPGSTAVIVIDMQNDFGSPGGMFDLAGIDISSIQRIVAPISAVLDTARAAGLPVIYTRQEHNADLTDAGNDNAPHRIKHRRMQVGLAVKAPDGSDSRVLVRDTWNTAVVDELTPKNGDAVVSKHRYSAFFETQLDSLLRAKRIETLVFVGATTSICVESTVRDATFRDYRCIVLRDCTAEPIALNAPRSNKDATLLTIELLFGWTADSADLISALNTSIVGATAIQAAAE